MTKATDHAKADIKWEVESLRITSFHPEKTELMGFNWWHDIFGEEPENRNLKLRDGIQVDDGAVDEIDWKLEILPLRVNWKIQKAAPKSVDDFILGHYDFMLNLFLENMTKWLKIAPPMTRLAFAAELHIPVEDLRDGYDLLADKYLNVDLNGAASDFFYRINRPRKSSSGITGLDINRLSMWSVHKWEQNRVALPAKTVSFVKESYSLRVLLDINTSHHYHKVLPETLLVDVFRELLEMAREILVRGDIV